MAIGLGIGLIGMQASSMLRPKGRESSHLHQMLRDLREGQELDEDQARKALAFWGLLSQHPAAAIALELSPLADLCVRLSPYKTFDPEGFLRIVHGAAALALLQSELAYEWRPWTLATPRFLHAASYAMLAGVRQLRQGLARGSADYLPDFDELAAEVAQVHGDTSSNALLESRSRVESRAPRRALP